MYFKFKMGWTCEYILPTNPLACIPLPRAQHCIIQFHDTFYSQWETEYRGLCSPNPCQDKNHDIPPESNACLFLVVPLASAQSRQNIFRVIYILTLGCFRHNSMLYQ